MYRQTHLHYILFVGLFCRTPIYVITQLPSVNNSNICLILLLMSRKIQRVLVIMTWILGCLTKIAIIWLHIT